MMHRSLALLLLVAASFSCLHSNEALSDSTRSDEVHALAVTESSTARLSLHDHHMHLFTPTVSEWLESELRLPALPPLGLDELMAIAESDEVVSGVVLSNAYFFGRQTERNARDLEKLRAVNDAIADAVVRHAGRLVGFMSINPLDDSALQEIDRCVEKGVFAGVKLHLANSGVDLRDPLHIERLAEVFRHAGSRDLAIVIHLRTGNPDYGRQDAEIFIDQVLPHAGTVPVQIAHLAGWGGYDTATDAAFGAFVDRAVGTNPADDNVYFDLSAVVRAVRRDSQRDQQSDGWWPTDRYTRVVSQLRKIGIERILFGTDWPDWTPQSYASDLRRELSLTTEEFQILFSNRAPYLR